MPKSLFREKPLFILLLPLFFFAHLLSDYFGVVELHLLGIPETYWYIGVSAVLFVVFSIRRPVIRRLAIWVVLAQFIFFFFSPIHAWLEDFIPSLSKYSVLLSILVIVLIVSFILLLKAKLPFETTYRYLNIVLLVLLAYELLMISVLHLTNGRIRSFTNTYPIANKYKACDTCLKPDIYYLVFDMYANSKFVKEFWNYDNPLDAYLDSSRFYNVKNSTSNYNYTVYSMGSVFNMNYHAIRNNHNNAFRSGNLMQQFYKNELTAILEKEGYKFYNYSWLPLEVDEPRLEPLAFTSPNELVRSQTLWFRFRRDIGWRFKFLQKQEEYTGELKPFFRKECMDNLSRIRKSYAGLRDVSRSVDGKPVFVYAHFLVPHAPFLFDSTGKVKPEGEWASTDHRLYLDQLKYTNLLIRDLCTALIKEARRPRIIILQVHVQPNTQTETRAHRKQL